MVKTTVGFPDDDENDKNDRSATSAEERLTRVSQGLSDAAAELQSLVESLKRSLGEGDDSASKS